MSPKRMQILRDSKIALIVLFTAFILGVWVGKASACSSFSECMDKSRSQKWLPLKKVYSDIALSYKLDDIHTTLKEMQDANKA